MFATVREVYLRLTGLDEVEEQYQTRQARVEEALESLNDTVTRVNIKKKLQPKDKTEPQYASGG